MLDTLGRNELKELLKLCTEEQQFFFKRMYSHKNLELPIDDAVDQMDSTKIDNALKQVQRTIDKNQ